MTQDGDISPCPRPLVIPAGRSAQAGRKAGASLFPTAWPLILARPAPGGNLRPRRRVAEETKGYAHGFSSSRAFTPKDGRERDAGGHRGVRLVVCGVRDVLDIPFAEISRTLSPPIPMRQVDGVGRLVPRDLIARPAGAMECHIQSADRLRSLPGTSD